jgi:tetratricopeptide (TPR) repeat protein
MALSEDGRLAEARRKIERSVALNPKNAHGAHGFAHVCYESGEPDTARAFLLPWLATYPRDGFFYGHLSWHYSLVEIALGHLAKAQEVYRGAIELGRHSGGPQQKVSDGCAFLWRSELAGHPRNAAAWRALYDYAGETLPRPGSGLADLHVILAHAVMGDDAALAARNRQIEELAAAGRYPSGSYLPALARLCRVRAAGFRRGNRGARSPCRSERAYRRQPRAARSDRVHPAQGLSRRPASGGGQAAAERSPSRRRFRRSG